MHHANHFYGHGHIMGRYVGADYAPRIWGYLQHGWNMHDGFAVGTVFADSLNVLLVQDNAGGSASASATASASASASSMASPSASASASATASASMEELPASGGVGTWVAMAAALALIGCGIGAIALVQRSFT